MDQKRLFYSAILSISLVLMVLLSLYVKNRFTANQDGIYFESQKSKKSFPLSADKESMYIASFTCDLVENKEVDTEFILADNEFEKIKIKLLTECEYKDVNGENQRIFLITGALFNDQDGIKLSYGGNVHRSVIYDPENANGNIIIGEIQRKQKIIHSLEKEPNFEKGQKLKIALSLRGNDLLEKDINDSKNTQISTYTYNYLIKYWENQESFWQTGDPKYLPETDDGKKILPAFGIFWQNKNEQK